VKIVQRIYAKVV